jgi:hypothetical protein
MRPFLIALALLVAGGSALGQTYFFANVNVVPLDRRMG